jgi:hypothetical protein
MAHPLKLAIPFIPMAVSESQFKVAPAGRVRVRVTALVSVVTVLPAPS